MRGSALNENSEIRKIVNRIVQCKKPIALGSGHKALPLNYCKNSVD